MSFRKNAWVATNYRILLVVILLIAAILRVYGLNNISPPGLEHDEVAHWLINQSILEGNHALYYTEAFGHEAGFHYVQTLFMILLGDNAFALRLPSAFSGILLVAVSFALTRRLFGIQTALLSAGLLAILFWPVFYSRLALRAIALPLLSGISAYLWWKAWQSTSSKASMRVGIPGSDEAKYNGSVLSVKQLVTSPIFWFVISGVFAGLSFYTYMASRIVPIFYIAYSIYLLLFHRESLKRNSWGIIAFFMAYALVALPLASFLLMNQGAEARISEVDQPLRDLLLGEFQPAIENFIAFIGMFGIRGDPLWRQNVAFLPTFEPIIAAFFYIGLFISLWRWRKPHYLFILLWLLMSAIPSIVTVDAPSSIRIINALPVIAVFPVIGLEVIHLFRGLSTVYTKLSPKFVRIAVIISLLTLAAVYLARTSISLFNTWPVNTEVQFVWQQALTEAAAFLDASADAGPTAIGGWTPETMDPPTMELTLKREDLALRYFDPTQSLIVPFQQDSQPSWIVLPAILPLASGLDSLLKQISDGSTSMGSFIYYEIPEHNSVSPQYPGDSLFDAEIKFIGYQAVSDGEDVGSGDNSTNDDVELQLVTFWQVEETTAEPRRIFLQAISENEEQVIGQDDALGAPAAHWRVGDIILQKHNLVLPANTEAYELRLGIYDPVSGRRLITKNGLDYLTLDALAAP